MLGQGVSPDYIHYSMSRLKLQTYLQVHQQHLRPSLVVSLHQPRAGDPMWSTYWCVFLLSVPKQGLSYSIPIAEHRPTGPLEQFQRSISTVRHQLRARRGLLLRTLLQRCTFFPRQAATPPERLPTKPDRNAVATVHNRSQQPERCRLWGRLYVCGGTSDRIAIELVQ